MSYLHPHMKALHEKRKAVAGAVQRITKHHEQLSQAVELQRAANVLKFNQAEVAQLDKPQGE